MTASSCCSLKLRRDLALEQGQSVMPGGVILLTRCEPTDVVSASAARRPDHMIGTPVPAKPGVNTPRVHNRCKHCKIGTDVRGSQDCCADYRVCFYRTIRIRYIMEYLSHSDFR